MITREELYALVWSVSGETAAMTHDVTDSYLGQVCAALDVPRPSRGWWAKKKAGTAPAPPPLPAARPGFPDRWAKGASLVGPDARFRRLPRTRPDAAKRGLHPLVRFASVAFAQAKTTADGVHLAPSRFDAIDLTCSAKTLENALSLAETLFKAFEARGHPVGIAAGHDLIRPVLENGSRSPVQTSRTPAKLWIPRAPTVTMVGGVPIGLAIMETSEEVLMRYKGHGEFAPVSTAGKVDGITWTEWQRRLTGRLMVVTYSPHFPAPWKRQWPATRRKMSSRTAEAIVLELESVAPALPHAGFFLQGR